MKTTTKAKVLKALDKIQGIVEKCGGPGSGVPGPCPTGGGKPNAGGPSESAKKAIAAMPAGTKKLVGSGMYAYKGTGDKGYEAYKGMAEKFEKAGFWAGVNYGRITSITPYKHPHGHSAYTLSRPGNPDEYEVHLTLASGSMG